MPVVAIVGRPNVGKSSLLNALVGRRISIVQDEPGVTRDRVSTPWDIDGRYVELVDTGGYGFVDPDLLTDHIRQQIELAMGRANLILFLVDAQSGLTAGDQEVATLLRKLNVKTVLVANKDDGTRTDPMLADFARLGLGTPIGVSAMNGRNLDQLRDLIVSSIDLSAAPTTIPAPTMMLAIVGKRNAGKSTLVNSIVEICEGDANRVIVSEVPGTTRDSIDVRVEKDGQSLIVIDTAGVRKKRHMVTNDIEFYSFHRAQRSVRRSDVVLLLIDATEPVSEPDKKLAQYITEQYKPVALVVNKWDKAKEIMREQRRSGGEDVDDRKLMAQYREYIEQEMPYLSYAPVLFTTARDGKNVQTVLDTAQHLFNQARQRITTGRLNAAMRSILDERTPSTPSGRRARIYYATQIETAPPTIVLVANKVQYIDEPYQRFVINRMRELLPFPQVPIRLIIRPRTTATAEGATPISETDDKPAKKPAAPKKTPQAKPARSKPPRKDSAKRRGR